MALSNIAPDQGANPPGILYNVYIADIADIDTIPPINATTLEISGDITMVASATFALVATVREDSELLSTMQGPTDSLHFLHEANIRVKGMTPAVLAGLNALVGRRVVALITQPDGTVNIIGNKTSFAEVTTMPTASGKAGSTDRKGTLLNIKAIGFTHQIPYYTGEMPI